MPTRKGAVPQQIYQLKVTLLDTKPPVWRRLLVPADSTLARLHHVLQIAMGWQDYHLHEFEIEDRRFGPSDPDDAGMGFESPEDERKSRLSSVLGKPGAEALYTYDFGDGWEHDIVVEKVLPPETGMRYPACVDGKLHCPPEDCGGILGFHDFLDAISNRLHPRHKEMRDWIWRRI
jgi:Plasmid pRiA4b ORF-3-like protein